MNFQLSDKHTQWMHYGIIAMLVIVIILLAVHMNQMKENYGQVNTSCSTLLGCAANTNTVMDTFNLPAAQNIDPIMTSGKQNAALLANYPYQGVATSWMVGAPVNLGNADTPAADNEDDRLKSL